VLNCHQWFFEDRGIDANKKVNGRKRQLLVDTVCSIWRVYVHAANQHDGPAGSHLMEAYSSFDLRLEKILGANAYCGIFAKKSAEKGFVFESSSRPESTKGFVPIAK
jgi:hypothetical protein